MACAFLTTVWSIMLLKTLLVADNVRERHGHVALLRRGASFWKSYRGSSEQPRNTCATEPGDASRFRLIHIHLLLAHLTACIGTGATVVRFTIPPTDRSCRLTLAVFISMAILFQTWIILFLEAKTEVTKMTRPASSRDPCWERVIKAFARFWSYLFTPISAVVAGIIVEHDILDTEGGSCYTDEKRTFYESSERTRWILIWFSFPQMVLVVLLVLLLGIFIMPLVPSRWSGRTLGISYRRIIVRNVICSAAITALVTGRMVMVNLLMSSSALHALLYHDGIIQTSSALVQMVILAVTEITLEIGFTSCFSTLRDEAGQKNCTFQDEQGSLPETTAREDTPNMQQFAWDLSYNLNGDREAIASHPTSNI